MKHSHSYREELPEPLRSLVEDLASAPVPEELLERAKQFSAPASKPKRSRRSGLALAVSVLAMSFCIAALVVREESSKDVSLLVKKAPPVPPRETEELPPPTLWAYRQAHSAESLDELLSHHATVLLPAGSKDDLSLFSRKEEL